MKTDVITTRIMAGMLWYPMIMKDSRIDQRLFGITKIDLRAR
jgi:hypothetical protein